jgi:uncharacterized protein YndB with AHSA1/START domain
MSRSNILTPNADLDLVLERVVDVPRELVWAAWTTPEHIKKWFTPAPWSTVDCEVDLRPGGKFSFVMRSPEGKDFPYEGCYLEVVPNERLVWTSVLEAGYRPSRTITQPDGIPFTGVITFEPHGKGTKYTAVAIHGNNDVRKRHDAMGFHDGWGKALDQLVALVKTMKV